MDSKTGKRFAFPGKRQAMECTQCGRPASRYTIAADGKEWEAVLCPECYSALMAGLQAGERRCPVCGMAFGEYRRTGLVGCAECYRFFRRELLPSVERIQGGTVHTGRTPSADVGENYELLLERSRLRGRLEQSLRRGDDAEAERLSEQIRALNEAIRGVRS